MKQKYALWVLTATILLTLTACTTATSSSAPNVGGASSVENPESEDLQEPESLLETLGTLDPNARRKIIVIDAGHGGEDTGAKVRQSGGEYFFEKDVNLKVALRLQDLLEGAGGQVYMIRGADEFVHHRSRGHIANEAGGDLFISIHCNASDYPSVNGTEVWYNEKVDLYDRSLVWNYGISSRRMAEVVHENLIDALNTEDREIRESSELAVLASTEMPAIIIEAAYMTNPGDFAIISSEGFVDTYAASAAEALIQVMNEAVK